MPEAGAKPARDGAVRRWWREPLVHFLALGLLAFTVHGLFAAPASDGAVLQLRPATRAELRTRFEEQQSRPPTEAEAAALAERWLDEEVLLRRAYELRLDRTDTVVRRRLVQRMRFLLEDTQPIRQPSELELREYLTQHVERYRSPAALSFQHRFFSRASRATSLEVDAQAAADALKRSADAEVSADSFFGGERFEQRRLPAVKRLFGNDFADAITKLPIGKWSGPVRSAYGLHVVRVEGRQPGPVPQLAAVRKRVLADLRRDRREANNREALDGLRQRYGAPTGRSSGGALPQTTPARGPSVRRGQP